MVDIDRLVAALRDTAAKATETKEISRPDFDQMMRSVSRNRDEPEMRTETVEAFSKDWIAGRLLGMADTLEALTKGDTNDQP